MRLSRHPRQINREYLPLGRFGASGCESNMYTTNRSIAHMRIGCDAGESNKGLDACAKLAER